MLNKYLYHIKAVYTGNTGCDNEITNRNCLNFHVFHQIFNKNQYFSLFFEDFFVKCFKNAFLIFIIINLCDIVTNKYSYFLKIVYTGCDNEIISKN